MQHPQAMSSFRHIAFLQSLLCRQYSDLRGKVKLGWVSAFNRGFLWIWTLFYVHRSAYNNITLIFNSQNSRQESRTHVHHERQYFAGNHDCQETPFSWWCSSESIMTRSLLLVLYHCMIASKRHRDWKSDLSCIVQHRGCDIYFTKWINPMLISKRFVSSPLDFHYHRIILYMKKCILGPYHLNKRIIFSCSVTHSSHNRPQ